MNYIKLFNTHNDYETYINSQDKILPNVSYCEDNNEVHYNPWTDPRLIITYNVEDTSEPTLLYHYIIDSWYDDETGQTVEVETIGVNLFEKIEIDGVEVSVSDLDSDEGYYQFNTTGNHTVKYTLLDPTTLGDDGTFTECSSITSIIIPNNLTTINNSAFSYCSGLTSVTIGEGVTTIGEKAFFNCTSLTDITIPNSIITIGDWAFHYCLSLTSLTIPDNVTSIGRESFYYCSNLIDLTLGNSLTTIGERAFGLCDGLINVTIPDSVTTIGEECFSHCSGLRSVTIGDGVTTISTNAFEYCKNLISVTIPDSVTTIGFNAFYTCYFMLNNFINNSSLDEVSNNYWGAIILDSENDGLCIKNNSLLRYRGTSNSVTIPSGVTSIGENAFNGCSDITSVTIPNSVTTIGNSAFIDCTGLTSITIPNSVTTIEGNAFNNCSGLTSITIGSGVISIDTYVFRNCNSLETITCFRSTAPTITYNTFDRIKANGILYVPTGSTGYNNWMTYLRSWTKVEQ